MKKILSIILAALLLCSIQFAFAEDTDGDGIDDVWEVRQFGNLTQKGSDDFDGDGKTNFQEFTTNTDPLEKEAPSFLNVATIFLLVALLVIIGLIALSKMKKKKK